jgi:twitching motility protein PilT
MHGRHEPGRSRPDSLGVGSWALGVDRKHMATLPELLKTLVEAGGSDLHITTQTPPQIRVHGHLQRVEGADLSPAETKQLTYSVLTDAQKKRFEETLELDFSFGLKGLARFRCNMFNQRGAVGAVYRVIPEKIRSFQDLALPPVLATLAERPRGLVLVTGPTGSGKSTTLAAMIDKINNERSDHILTIEDPIEFVHQHKGCLVNQREVHSDTQSFSAALRAALREDPDIVLIGEMRDLETVESALKIAETGHLTFGTLHTNSAAQTINRIIDIFPANQQGQIRTQLSLVLEGIVCQALLPKIGGGRVVSLEIMIPTPAIRNLIREDKIHQIYSAMQTGQEKVGMQTMNQSLATLYQTRKITLETAIGASSNREELQDLINRGVGVVAGAGMGRPAGMPPRPAGR